MKFERALFCLIGTYLLQESTPTNLGQDLTSTGTDLSTASLPCLGPEIQGLVYTFETYLLRNHAIKSGCEVQLGIGTVYRFSSTEPNKRILRYYVRVDDADGQEMDIRPGGFVLLPSKSNDSILYDFHQICFPPECYTPSLKQDLRYCIRPDSSWQCGELKVGHLGRARRNSMVYIKCQQNDTTIPIRTSKLPAGLSDKLLEYDRHEFLEPHLSYEYRMYPTSEPRLWVSCVLRKPLLSPNTTLRTFFYGNGDLFATNDNSPIISSTQVSSLESGNLVERPDKFPTPVSCFPLECLTATKKSSCDYFSLAYKVTIHRAKSQPVRLLSRVHTNGKCSKKIISIVDSGYKIEATVIDDPDRQNCWND